MRIHRNVMLSAVVALAVAAPAAAGQTNDPQAAKSQEQTDTQTVTCNDDGDYIEYTGDPVMWPPNHKTQTYNVDAVDSGENDDATTSIFTASTHDEYTEDGTEWNGTGNTDNDAQDAASSAEPATDADGDGRAETTVELRSERSGRGDGRTYTITATAEFDEGACTAEFTVEVPHDMRSDQGAANGKNGGASLDENGQPKGGGNS